MALQYGSGGGIQVKMGGPYGGGGGSTSKITTISAPAANWKGGQSPYSQLVAVDGIAVSSKLDVQLTEEQVLHFENTRIAFQAVNNNGIVTLYAYGSVPDVDLEIQATITEVIGGSVILGDIFTVIPPQADYAQADPSKADFIKNKPDVAIAQAQTTADAAKTTAEAALARTGGAMTGHMTVLDPAAAANPAPKKYVDDTVANTHLTATVTLSASGWSGSGPYTQSVSIPGILATDQPHFGPVYSANWEAEKEAFALVDDLDTAAGIVTFTCFEEKPGINLTVQLEVNR